MNISNSADFQLHLQFAVPPEQLFTALATLDGARQWWTIFCDGSEDLGGQLSYRFPAASFYAVMKTLRKEPPGLLEWECTDSSHSADCGYSDLRDWIGTIIRFEIQDLGNGRSQLDFTHSRLTQLECFEQCSSGWSFFLNESLRGYLENGKGQPWDKE